MKKPVEYMLQHFDLDEENDSKANDDSDSGQDNDSMGSHYEKD